MGSGSRMPQTGDVHSRTDGETGRISAMDELADVDGKGRRGRIVRRYFLVFAVLVGGSLLTSAIVEMTFRYRETRQNIDLVHRQMGELAALRIWNYIDDIAKAIQLTAQAREVIEHGITERYVFDLRNLLKNVPAIRNLSVLSSDGRERLRQSRIG